MAEYIRFRLTSAKLGVTMALAALIGGVADRAEAQSASSSKPPALFVKLTGITGQVRTVLAKIEEKVDVLTKDIASIEQKQRTDYYTKDQVGKIYMKHATANAEFLKKADTAANSSLLDNKPVNAFVQAQARHQWRPGRSVARGRWREPDVCLSRPGTNGEIIVVCHPARRPPAGIAAPDSTTVRQFTLPAVHGPNGQDQRRCRSPPGDHTSDPITGTATSTSRPSRPPGSIRC